VNYRHLALGAAVAALALANFWRWSTPQEPPRERAAAGSSAFRADDFQLRVGFVAPDAPPVARNLFQPRLPPAPPPAKKVEVAAPPPPPPPPAPEGPPPKTAEQLAEEAAQAELKQIRLVGVVFRGDKGQAFLVKGDQLYMVNAGGKVGERFMVEAIRADSIQLKDPASRVLGQIQVSGK
jgi:type IV secretory pathway VirB10-like protein